jgi:glycogen debranching enzyme
MPEERFFAQALDRDKRQVHSVSSNPGHCLWSRIVDPRKAEEVVSRLVAPDMFSGWGIRTLSTGAISYNPMSYHNGSIWPHDNSIIAWGMRRYGFRREAELVARSIMEACLRFPDHRIPELFCGFVRDRRFGAGPGEYLVSCSPQAWGAAALFHFLQTLLGVEADLVEGRLRIDPVETALYSRLRVEGMRVGDGELDFTVDCGEGVRVTVDRAPAGLSRLELPA